MKIVVVSGGFDPLHSGHINLLEQAATYGNKLVVLVNSDEWLIRKKGSFLLPCSERRIVTNSIVGVHSVLPDWDDSDGTACNAIKDFHTRYKVKLNAPLLFANGGDRVPNGSSLLSNKTTALLSNLIAEPSGLLIPFFVLTITAL